MSIKKIFPQSVKNIYHLLQAIIASIVYGFPSRKLKIIGVTGTDGKTTAVQMIARILESAGKKVAVASTINFRINGEETENQTKFTTLSSFQIQKFIQKAVKNGCEYLVLETSSHSLDQYRVWGIEFKTAVITNVTREHLDYHETIEKYREAKRKLFRNVETAIVNLDMENPNEFLNCDAKDKYGYTTANQNANLKMQNDNLKFKIIRAENIELGIDGSRFTVDSSQFNLNLIGEFNIENALAATCVGISEGIELETIRKALEEIKTIPGRMESIPNNKGLNIIVDFALTPNALQKLYELIDSIKHHSDSPAGGEESRDSSRGAQNDKKIVAVFGACGERDRGKRPIIGKIVSEFADYIILTDDEPYNEDPKIIIEEIVAGIPLCHSELDSESKGCSVENVQIPGQARNDTFYFTENANLWKIPDRRQAIKKALLLAKPGDFVIVTGMGAEDSRAVGDERIPWNDKKVILEELNRI